jgi:hypothetical protein
MTIDFVDRAFLQRMMQPAHLVSAGPAVIPAGESPPVVVCEEPAAADPVVLRLVASYRDRWERLAWRVEAACAAGDRVIAITGRARGDGCSTTVNGLAHVLRLRGRDVTCRDLELSPTVATLAAETGDGLVLVDAGVWFPGGPLHRGRLARRAFGCHAAVLVRRANRPPCPACAGALTAIGIRVLGEVVTFAEAHDSGAA